MERRALHVPIGTDAAVASLGLKHRTATLAVVEELASVGRHGVGRAVIARRTGNSGSQNDLRHVSG